MFIKSLLSFSKSQKGQALLIIVLIMVIALTVGLSVVSRTITNLRTASEQASSQKALSAAEAGVQRALVNVSTPLISGGSSGNATYTTSVASISGTTILVDGGISVPKDDGAYIWLSPYTPDYASLWQTSWPTGGGTGNLTLYWGSPSDSCGNNTAAALEVDIISGTRAVPVLTRYAFDPCSRGNNFTQVLTSTNPIQNLTFNWTTSIQVTQGLLARVMPIYSSSVIGASGGTNSLPPQGSIIVSTGTSENTQRKITAFQGYPELPTELFPYGLFSP